MRAVALAQTDVPPAERALGAVVIQAPSAGRLSRFAATRGQSVDAGQLLGEVVAPDGLGLRASLVPADAEAVALGAPAEVADRGLRGVVASIAGAVDAETGLVPIVVSLSTSAKAPRVGETVLVEIDRGAPLHGILLPAAALEIRDDLPRVMVVEKGDLAHLVTVTLLARGPDQVLVTGEGLAAGARVAVDGNYNLPDGAHVVIAADEKPAPGAAAAPPAMTDPGAK